MSKTNYLYTFTILNERKGEVCWFPDLPSNLQKHCSYVSKFLDPAVKAANCGWSGVKYLGVRYPNSDYIYPYMVLYVNDRPERWIPVDGNSDGCNLQVLGENLW